jgi:hypothetical protein
MKKLFTILSLVVLTTHLFAQAPQKMTYQAVVRNSSNALAKNSTIGMKVTLLQGSVSGTAVYVERHATVTNENGLLNIEIGGGTVVSGTYQNGIFWAGGPYFLKTEIDLSGGTNYTITATSELLSVPYSNYSHVSGFLAQPSMNVVGAYKEVTPSPLLYSPVLVSYLDQNKVMLKMDFQLRTDIDPNNGTFDFTWCGVVSGNKITFSPALNIGSAVPEFTATVNGNSLTFNLVFASDPSYIYAFNLVKQ